MYDIFTYTCHNKYKSMRASMPYLDPTGQVLVSSEPARLSGPGTAEDCHCGTSGIGEDPRVY